MSRAKLAKQIAGKVAAKSANAEFEAAQALLSRINSPEIATKLQGAEKKAYLEALDLVHGDRAKRAKDLGFGEETYYHGTKSNFDSFAEKPRGSFFSKDPKFADGFTQDGYNNFVGNTIPAKIKNVDKFADPAKMESKIVDTFDPDAKEIYSRNVQEAAADGKVRGLKNEGNNWATVESEGVQKYLKGNNFPGYHVGEEGARNISVYNPADIRSTNAAFDPRFKDSADILAATAKNPTAKLIAQKAFKHITPNFGLGSAFDQINEPLEQLNEPRNRAIEIASKALGNQLDLSGGKVPGMAEQNADILNTAANFALPASQDLLLGGMGKLGMVGKLGRGAKASEIAEKAALKLEKAVEQGYKPTAAEGLAYSKFKGQLPVIATAGETSAAKNVADLFHKPAAAIVPEKLP